MQIINEGFLLVRVKTNKGIKGGPTGSQRITERAKKIFALQEQMRIKRDD